MRFFGKSGIGLCVSMLCASTSAFAQTSPSGDDGLSREGIQEITVTAQRRSENLQDVPIAVSAFSGKELEVRQVSNTLGLIAYVPNLQGNYNTGLSTANTYSLRGLANTESISTFDPPVGTYVDDIYISRQNANNFSFFDVDRIEVLRGPQGTLFGRNTIGGAINIIMKKPADEVGGYIEVGYGKYDRLMARGSVDLPIVSDRLLSKISAYYIHDDGYVDNKTTGETLNYEHSWGVRGALQAKFSDTVTWDLAGDYTFSSYANVPNFRPAGGGRIAFTSLRTDTPLGADLVSSELADNTLGNTARSYSLSSNFEVEAGDATINIITGYRHLSQEFTFDLFDGVNLGTLKFGENRQDYISSEPGTAFILTNDGVHKQFSQEIKISGSAFDGFLDYVGGFYYLNEKNKTNFANITVPLASSATVTQDRIMRNGTEAYAGYLQLDAHVSPRLKLTAGIRYTDEYKDIHFTPNDSPLPPGSPLYVPFDTQDLIDAGIPVSMRSKVWTPRFAADYKLNDDVMLFASATKGFKSGGWNSRANYAELAVEFTRETVWSYEVGLRSEFLDRRLRVNLTGFYYIDKDNQLPAGYYDPITSSVVYLTRNYADQENYGLESEITLVPIDGLNLTWSVGLQNARYKNLAQPVIDQLDNCRNNGTGCNTGIVTADGNIAKPARAPDFTSTLGVNYTFDLSDSFELTPAATWQYVEGNWISPSNSVMAYQKAHHVFNGGLTLRDKKNGWSLSAECTNCFNTSYKVAYLGFFFLNEPGRWMIRAKKTF